MKAIRDHAQLVHDPTGSRPPAVCCGKAQEPDLPADLGLYPEKIIKRYVSCLHQQGIFRGIIRLVNYPSARCRFRLLLLHMPFQPQQELPELPAVEAALPGLPVHEPLQVICREELLQHVVPSFPLGPPSFRPVQPPGSAADQLRHFRITLHKHVYVINPPALQAVCLAVPAHNGAKDEARWDAYQAPVYGVALQQPVQEILPTDCPAPLHIGRQVLQDPLLRVFIDVHRP